MENDSLEIQDYYLWILLAQTRDAVFKARQKELTPHGISARHTSVLSIVQIIGHNATPAEIARWLMQEPHSVSEILNRMKKKGLVKKIKDLHRKNQVRIELTEEGRQIYRDSIVTKCIPNIMSVLSGEERQQLASNLLKLRGAAIKSLGIQYEVPTPPVL